MAKSTAKTETGDWSGKAGAGETGSYKNPSHLTSDPTLTSYVSEVAKACQADYDKNWGPQYHEEMDESPAERKAEYGDGVD